MQSALSSIVLALKFVQVAKVGLSPVILMHYIVTAIQLTSRKRLSWSLNWYTY